MGLIGVILLVIFVLVCIFLIALVLLQNSDGDGLGGLFGGGSNSAFGSRSASVLTKVTYVTVFLFFLVAFFLALVNRSPSDQGFEQEARTQRAAETQEGWWNETEAGDSAPDAAEPAAGNEVPAAETAAQAE